MADLVPLVALAAFVALLAAGWLWFRRMAARWLDQAGALGFEALGKPSSGAARPRGFPTLRGQVGLHEAQVRTYVTGAGKNTKRWTAWVVALPDADPGFALRLTREGVGARLAELAGGQDIQVGDAAFDAARFARALAAHAGEVPAASRDRVLALLPATAGATPALALTRKGLRADPDETRLTLAALGRLADAVASAAPRPKGMPAPPAPGEPQRFTFRGSGLGRPPGPDAGPA